MPEIVIRTAQDIIDALEQNPEFLNRVRNHILTKRLLDLPDQVDALTAAVRQLADTVAQLADRVQKLEDRQEVFDQRQQRFERRQHGYDSKIRGADYHAKVLRNIEFRVSLDLGLPNPRIIAADGSPALPEWHRILQLALNNGDIGRDDIEDLTETDIVLATEDGRLTAVEAAVSADVNDVARARRRADLLTQATRQPAVAAVICASRNREAEAAAGNDNVALLHMRE